MLFNMNTNKIIVEYPPNLASFKKEIYCTTLQCTTWLYRILYFSVPLTLSMRCHRCYCIAVGHYSLLMWLRYRAVNWCHQHVRKILCSPPAMCLDQWTPIPEDPSVEKKSYIFKYFLQYNFHSKIQCKPYMC